jgi:hypothetical protein
MTRACSSQTRGLVCGTRPAGWFHTIVGVRRLGGSAHIRALIRGPGTERNGRVPVRQQSLRSVCSCQVRVRVQACAERVSAERTDQPVLGRLLLVRRSTAGAPKRESSASQPTTHQSINRRSRQQRRDEHRTRRRRRARSGGGGDPRVQPGGRARHGQHEAEVGSDARARPFRRGQPLVTK